MEIDGSAIPFSPNLDCRQAKSIPGDHSSRFKVFPDSGATICLGGPRNLLKMGLTKNNLVPIGKNGSNHGMLLSHVRVGCC